MREFKWTKICSGLTIYHLLFLGLLLRLLAVFILPDHHFDDAVDYRQMGVGLFHGTHVTWQYMPLYPILTYLTGGGFFQYLLDILLSTLTIGIVYQISKAIFNHQPVALLTAFFCAIYPHFIFYAVSGLTETSDIFFICLAFYLLYTKRYFWGSVVAVLAIYTRPTTDIITPILLILFVLIVHRQNWRMAIKVLCIYLLVYSVMLSPWWIYNYHRYGSFVRLDLNLGQVLYAGNNPKNTSGGGIMNVDVGLDDFSKYGNVNPVIQDSTFKAAAIQYIKAHPAHVLKLDLYTKMLRFWRLWPYASGYQSGVIIAASILSYGTMLLCFLIYLVRWGRRDFRAISPILAFMVYLTGIYLVTIASIRYRLPLEPFLIILGTYAFYQLLAMGRIREHVEHQQLLKQ